MKKLVSVLAILTCALGLTACGGTEVNTVDGTAITDISTESYVIYIGETMVSQIDELVREGYTSDDTSDEYIGAALDDYANSYEEIGEITGYDNEQAVIDDDGNYLINIGVIGTEMSADIVITFDATEGSLTSFSTNVRYTFGELITQAALNTLLGMGTTFVVLIILALLIYCFKFIGVFQARKSKKEALRKEAEAPSAAASTTDAQTAAAIAAALAAEEEEVDDAELIAVISAAVAAYEEEETGSAVTEGFVVRSIRKSRRRF